MRAGGSKKEKVLLANYVEGDVLRLAEQSNVYSCIVRGLVDAVRLDLEGGLALDRKEREGKRDPLEMLVTAYSKEVTKTLYRIFSDKDRAGQLMKRASAWVNEVYASACKVFEAVFLFNFETVSRLTVHTKNPYMPLEIGLAWHPYMNIPYIPSTTLRGALRAYARSSGASKICGLDLDAALGTTGKQGMLVFFDAVPVDFQSSLIEPDVVAPHYPEVEGRIDEARVRPRPLVFPVVSPGVKFSTVVACKMYSRVDPQCLMKELASLISDALRWGIGARTSVGYGYVRVELVSAGGEGVKR